METVVMDWVDWAGVVHYGTLAIWVTGVAYAYYLRRNPQ